MRAQAPSHFRRLPSRRFEAPARAFSASSTTTTTSTPRHQRRRGNSPLLRTSRPSFLRPSSTARLIFRSTVDGKEEGVEGGDEASTSSKTTTTTATKPPSPENKENEDDVGEKEERQQEGEELDLDPDAAAFANLVICAALATALGAATGIDPWATLFPSGEGDGATAAAAATTTALQALAWGAAASPLYVAFLLFARNVVCGGGIWWSEVEGRGDLAKLSATRAAAWAWALAVADGVVVRGLVLGWLSRLATNPAGVDLAEAARAATSDEALLRPLSDAALLSSSPAAWPASSFFGGLLSSSPAAATAAAAQAEVALFAAGIGGAPVSPVPMPASWFWPFLSLASGAVAAAISCYEPPPSLRAGFEIADDEDDGVGAATGEAGARGTTFRATVDIGLPIEDETLTMREILWAYWRDEEPSSSPAADGEGGGEREGGRKSIDDDDESKASAAAGASAAAAAGASASAAAGASAAAAAGASASAAAGAAATAPSTTTSTTKSSSDISKSKSGKSNSSDRKRSWLGDLISREYRDDATSDADVEAGANAAARALAPLFGLLGIRGAELEERLSEARADYARLVKTGSFDEGEGGEEGGVDGAEPSTSSTAASAARDGSESSEPGKTTAAARKPTTKATTNDKNDNGGVGRTEQPRGEPRSARAARWPATDGPLRSWRVPALVAAEATGLAALTLATHSLLASTVAHAIGLFALCVVERKDGGGKGKGKAFEREKRGGDGEVVLR